MELPRVLFVDDDETVLAGLRRTVVGLPLETFFESSGVVALERLATEIFDLVVSDQRMPSVSGVEVLEVASRLRPHSHRLLLTGNADLEVAMTAINRCGIQGLLTKPWDVAHLRETVLGSARAAHFARVATSDAEAHGLKQAMAAIVGALEAKSPRARGHSEIVSLYSVAIAEELPSSPEEVESARVGGLLHDCGKISLPERVLQGAEALGEEDLAVLRTHCEVGYRIVAPVASISEAAAAAVLHHHERWDGAGYPQGLVQDAIPLSARIVAVADACEALTEPGASRLPPAAARVIEHLRLQSGHQFDPEVASVACRLVASGRFAILRASVAGLVQQLQGDCGRRKNTA